MNVIVLLLGIWAILQVIIALWGLFILDKECKNSSLYTYIRTLLCMSAVIAIVFFATLICNRLCGKDDDEHGLSAWLVTVASVFALAIIIVESLIISNIEDCVNKEAASNFKNFCIYGGIVTSIFPLLYGMYRIYKFVTKKRKEYEVIEKKKEEKVSKVIKQKIEEDEMKREEEEREQEKEEIKKYNIQIVNKDIEKQKGKVNALIEIKQLESEEKYPDPQRLLDIAKDIAKEKEVLRNLQKTKTDIQKGRDISSQTLSSNEMKSNFFNL